jgi:hypothetical protein
MLDKKTLTNLVIFFKALGSGQWLAPHGEVRHGQRLAPESAEMTLISLRLKKANFKRLP